MELIGPVAAQNKVDAMQNKSFVPLDPTETPTNFSRHRSRSVGNRRGKSDKEASKPLLPMDKFPATSAGTYHTCTVPEIKGHGNVCGVLFCLWFVCRAVTVIICVSYL